MSECEVTWPPLADARPVDVGRKGPGDQREAMAHVLLWIKIAQTKGLLSGRTSAI